MIVLLLALKSLLVAAATLLLLRVTRRRSAAERSTIAHLGLFALVALPLASLALPSLSLLPSPVSPAVEISAPATAPAPGAPVTTSDNQPSASTAIGASRVQPSALAATAVSLARYAYLLPTAALLLLTLAALLRLVGLRSRAEVLVDPTWLAALARTQRRMGFKAGTALLRSDELASPISWGLMRPTIVLSEEAARSPDQAEAIIAHELAHVVQLDWAKLMLARVATAAFWFNPLAWVLAREAHQLREEAADDAVLAADIDGSDYAELLIGVARHECRGVLLGAHGVAPSKNSLRRRVARVLDASPARGPSGKSWVTGFAAGMLTMAAPLAALTFAPTQAASMTGTTTTVSTTRVATATTSKAAVSTAASRPVALPSDAAAPSEPPSDRGDPHPVPGTTNVDDLIAMRAVDVTPDFKRAMAEAGLPNLTLNQLVQAKSLDLTPEYVRAMRAAGMPANFAKLRDARALDLDPAYIAAMRKLGVIGPIDDYVAMISVDVTPQYVRRLKARGYSVTSPAKLTELKSADFDPDDATP